jgi:hypothetical protein
MIGFAHENASKFGMPMLGNDKTPEVVVGIFLWGNFLWGNPGLPFFPPRRSPQTRKRSRPLDGIRSATCCGPRLPQNGPPRPKTAFKWPCGPETAPIASAGAIR